MTVDFEERLSIVIYGKDIELFRSGLQKVCDDLKRIGLKHTGITIEESELIYKLNKELK